jgi:hypothetical protein
LANAREPTLEFKSSEGLHSSVLKLALRSFMKILKSGANRFILKTLINKYLHKNKKKLYLCFVDTN